ncbi:hypothetical protein ACIBJI_39060 [Nocardia sp. NPDC050408]|uniref:hypothetical protein n=1 Tax=unclassified Nocardia TaxID=2637762 RepID=UPI003446C64B
MEFGAIQRRDVLADGGSDSELRRKIAREGWARVRPGCYLPPDAYESMDRPTRYLLLIEATARRLSSSGAISHQSSAALHELPLWDVPLDRVHVTRRQGSGHRGRHLHVHCAPFRDEDVTTIASLQVLVPDRTVVDLARTLELEQAVVLGDAAMHRFSITRASLRRSIAYAEGRPGYRAALRTIEVLDGRSESVGESRSRVLMARLGLPKPELQTVILDEVGQFVGRTDFCWPELGVIGEFDGKVKYDNYLGPHRSAADAVYREKLREDRLRDLGWEVIRWTWPDLTTPDLLGSRFHRAQTRTTHRPHPLGSILRTPPPN